MAMPIESIREKNIDVAIWDNGKDNDGNPKKSVTLRKSWKKQGEENYNEIKMTLFPNEIDAVLKVLNDAKAKL